MLAYLIVCHMIGDFLLQNEWMAQNKARYFAVCLVHVCFYSLPFLILMAGAQISELTFAAIVGQHFLQDKFQLHLKYMRLAEQTPPDKWPVGPLCVDQSMHLAFIALAYTLFK